MGIRIMVKGGVWKNSEDEILKAAVMKYGLNQWPRVASLLNRKSAAQCKARWYEWLDPSIKKTEWTREEEEKLLHLAKILPAQWRTIAPMVGRTPAQCLEHYERLLDAAQQKTGDMEGEMKDDPRKLRPGEIDPAPETKPARPDPIDMDEDEKEMLSEARARLANTKGKKAKRKAREKMLMEAKRLASLQKRRELKAAGLELKMREKKRKYIDYGREIPFQRTAPAGFYTTAEEKEEGKKQALDPRFEALRVDKMEAERRDQEEARERARDKKRHKKLTQENLPQMVMAVNNVNDPVAIRRRMPLSLPAPQVTDQDLEEIVKMGATNQGLAAGDGATAALLGDYRDAPTPLATPMRTPRTGPGQDVVMQEARNLIALQSAETPLKGGEAVILEEGTGFEGHVPKSGKMQTPNAMLSQRGGSTPLAGSATPLSVRSMATSSRNLMPGGATPMRDQLGLNQAGAENMQLMVLSEKRRQKAIRAQLADGLGSLPAPQYSYEISVPDLEDQEEEEVPIEEDAADRDARLAAKKRAQEEAELERRSTVLKRGLPRPAVVNPDAFKMGNVEGDELAAADALVQQELLAVLQHDASKYPIKGNKKRKSGGDKVVEIPIINPKLLAQARALVEKEAKDLLDDVGISTLENELEEAWIKGYNDLAYFPNRQAFGRVSGASKQDRLAALMFQFDTLASSMEKDAKNASKLESRLNLSTGGYNKRAATLITGINELLNQIDEMKLEVSCFKRLKTIEDQAVGKRFSKLQAEVADVSKREEQLQASYVELLDERDRIHAILVDNNVGGGEEDIEMAT